MRGETSLFLKLTILVTALAVAACASSMQQKRSDTRQSSAQGLVSGGREKAALPQIVNYTPFESAMFYAKDRFGEYYSYHAKITYSQIGKNPPLAATKKVTRYIAASLMAQTITQSLPGSRIRVCWYGVGSWQISRIPQEKRSIWKGC
jgi:hypothetical protein